MFKLENYIVIQHNKLRNVVELSTKRVDQKNVCLENFITTDNMLQNKAGITLATNLPPQGNSMSAYNAENILVANIRPYLRKIWFADRDGGCSADVLVFEVNRQYNSKFVFYTMFREDFFDHMMRGAKGTKMPRGDKRQILDYLIPKFDIETQTRIAAVLSALDAKIELNNRINAELEAMAKTLYDYWFVQFDFPFPSAGSGGGSKPYKTSGGKMVWNNELKREVPEGWEVQKMAEWIDVEKSGDWGKDKEEGDFNKKVICFRGADINGLNGLDELKPPERYILEKNSFKFLKSHDVIIEISGGSPTQSTGRLAFITDATIKRFEHPLICSNFCKPITIKNKKLLFNFVYYWKSLYDAGVFFSYEGKTSGIKNLLFDSFISSYYTVVPDEKIVARFYQIMETIQNKKQIALTENQQLSSLRDWLLPMLMNGQVGVGGAD
jgi:type I restriction enzyme, S subunit